MDTKYKQKLLDLADDIDSIMPFVQLLGSPKNTNKYKITISYNAVYLKHNEITEWSFTASKDKHFYQRAYNELLMHLLFFIPQINNYKLNK